MISFNLTCSNGHGFEGWFKSSHDYEDQLQRGLLICPYCDDAKISKALMAPHVGAKSNTKTNGVGEKSVLPSALPQNPQPAPQISPEMAAAAAEAMAEAMAEMRKVQNKIIETCDDVGESFAEEARKIHYGETDARGIYGVTSDDEAEALYEEGIEITKMPWLPKEQ